MSTELPMVAPWLNSERFLTGSCMPPWRDHAEILFSGVLHGGITKRLPPQKAPTVRLWKYSLHSFSSVAKQTGFSLQSSIAQPMIVYDRTLERFREEIPFFCVLHGGIMKRTRP